MSKTETEKLRYQAEFANASLQYQVPVHLLKAIAYVESHWKQRIPPVSPETGMPPAYGIMGLRNDNWFGHSLEIAAKLVGKSDQDLILSSSLNIQGAAAYLRDLALAENQAGAAIALNSESASSVDLLPWVSVVMKYSGIPDPQDAKVYVQHVMKVAAHGHKQKGMDLEAIDPQENWLKVNPFFTAGIATAPQTAEYSAATWSPSPNFKTGGITPKYVVIHVTEGSYAGALSWLKNPQAQVSAHYLLRSQDGAITQLVSEKNEAWHARCWNPLAIGIEHEGFLDDDEDFTNAMYESSAKLVAYLSQKYQIPSDNMHIIGHDFWQTPEFKQQTELANCNDHTDPGSLWNWSRYFSLIKQ